MAVYQIMRTTMKEHEHFTAHPTMTLFSTSYAHLTQYVKQNTLLRRGTGADVLDIPLNYPNPAGHRLGRVTVIHRWPGIRHWSQPKKSCKPHVQTEPGSESSEYMHHCEGAISPQELEQQQQQQPNVSYGNPAGQPFVSGAPFGPGVGGQVGVPYSEGPLGVAAAGAAALGGAGAGAGMGNGFASGPYTLPYSQPMSQPPCGDGAHGHPYGAYPSGSDCHVGDEGGFRHGGSVPMFGGNNNNNAAAAGMMPDPGFDIPGAGVGCGGAAEAEMQHPRRHFAYLNNGLGHLYLDAAELTLNNRPVISHDGIGMDIIDEVHGKAGKSTDALVGRSKSERDLIKKSSRAQTLFTRLRMWFCETPGNSLPISLIDPHETLVSLRLKTRNLQDCYQTSDGSVPRLIDSDNELQEKDIKIEVRADIYYLSKQEAEKQKREEHVFIMNQLQFNGGHTLQPCGSSVSRDVKYELPFSGLVTEIFFALQDERHIKNKDFFNFSGVNGYDPIESAELTVNNHPFEGPHDPMWLRAIEPLEYHSKIPDGKIYMWSACRHPEENEAFTGAWPFCPELKWRLHLKLQVGLHKTILYAWAKSLNHFVVRNRRAGISSLPAASACW